MLGNFQCRGVLLIWIIFGQEAAELALARVRVVVIFSPAYHISFPSLSGRRLGVD